MCFFVRYLKCFSINPFQRTRHIIVIVKNTFLKYNIFIFTYIHCWLKLTSNGFSKILLKFEQPQVCIVFCEPKNPLCLL